MDNVTLRMKNINKSFHGVQALQDISFDLRKGEVHALLGENGAGKSTLIKVLSGIYQADSGTIEIDGQEVHINGPRDAIALGIAVIHQELVLAENMTIAENVFMGRETVNKLGFIDYKTSEREVQKLLDSLGTGLKAATQVSELSTPQKQVVEIVKALTYNARIMIMDEPTASLSNKEVDMLFSIIDRMKEQGISIIYISHRMEELFLKSDRVTVMRDGEYVATLVTRETDSDELVRLMVGRKINDFYTHKKRKCEELLLEVKDLSTEEKLRNVSLKLNKGEILGLSGLVGAGRTELARAIFGIDRIDSGTILYQGRELAIHAPEDAIRAGIILIPESRKEQGLILGSSVGFNITISVLDEFIKGIRVNRAGENRIIDEYFSKLSIKASSPEQIVGSLSGGNQQKAVISKWLATQPSVIIMDEPTRGIDVGAKAEIYAMMDELANAGTSILMISSELPEILGMCDRIYVMTNGSIVTCIDGEEATQEGIMRYAAGVVQDGE